MSKPNQTRVKKYGHVPLYTSLHRVGDDDTKRAIEDNLEEILDEHTMRIVRATFAYYTKDY